MKKQRIASLGIDCGGTNIKLAFVTKTGELLESATEPIDFSRPPEKVIEDIAERIRKFSKRCRMTGVKSIGMGIAGEVDQKKGIVRFSPNLGWKDVPLGDTLSKKLKIRVFVENDANCAAWGAFCLDAKRDCDNLLCLTLGTGVGGGIVIGRKLYRGSTGSAGEIGHMAIKYDGRACKCGNYGCLESYLGAWALIEMAEEGLKRREAPILESLLKKGMRPDPKLIDDAARKGDPFCKQIWRDAGERLGAALATLVNIFNPDRIILSGGVSKVGDLLLKPALHTLGARAFKTPARHVQVSVSKHDQNLGVAGAALLFWE